MATRRRTAARSTTRSTRRTQASRRKSGGLSAPSLSLGISPAVVRSLIGIVLLVLGAVTLIALMLPGQGALTDWWRNLAVPYFGTRSEERRVGSDGRLGGARAHDDVDDADAVV